MNPQPGEICLANIPFTNGLAWKVRPVLVLWLDEADLVVAAVTSAQPRSAEEVALLDWISAGLRVPSLRRQVLLLNLPNPIVNFRAFHIATDFHPPDAVCPKSSVFCPQFADFDRNSGGLIQTVEF